MISIRNILVNKFTIVAIISSVMSGCSLISKTTPIEKLEPIDPRQQIVYCPASLFDLTKQSLSLESKISVTTDRERWFGKIKWNHSPNQDDFEILSPLGQVIAQIKLNQNGVSLFDGKNTYHAITAEELTLRTFGWKLPVAGIVHWLVGQHYPYSPSIPEKNNQGQLMRLSQSGWTITYHDDYAPAGRYLMPRTLDIMGTDQHAQQLIRIRILNQAWDIK